MLVGRAGSVLRDGYHGGAMLLAASGVPRRSHVLPTISHSTVIISLGRYKFNYLSNSAVLTVILLFQARFFTFYRAVPSI